MAAKIKVGNARITLTDPRFVSSKTGIILAAGRCKDGSFAARNGESVTFFPRVGPDKPRRLRRVLDAIGGPPAFKIEHLEVHLSASLGTFTHKIDSSIFDAYRECYDFRAELFANYVRCDASIGRGQTRVTFRIDFPVGAISVTRGKPACCPDKPEIFTETTPRDAPPDETTDAAARTLYDMADKQRQRDLDRILKMGLNWKLDLPRKHWLNPDWGFDQKYDAKERGKDKPIIKIKRKFGF